MTNNEIKENEIQDQINKCLKSFKSLRFNAGAGSGKTFALVEGLKYLLTLKEKQLKNNNQKIACITYTNVAVNEILARLGNTNLVVVSTIHERLWDLIKVYQKELIEIHKDKLEVEIERIESELNDSSHTKFEFYAKLSEKEKEVYLSLVQDTKNLLYQNENKGAAEFRKVYEDNLPKNIELLFLKAAQRNKQKFVDTAKQVYKKLNYQDCLERIKQGKNKQVEYDSKTNLDRLHRMKFSHDTLLEYSLKIIKEYSKLKRIIIDKYPYLLIDEYQDTSESVVRIVKELNDYAEEKNRPWLVGYFGDNLQTIYDDGIGSKIVKIHNGIEKIDKPFNRRSHTQIIDVINKIRTDDLKQVPIDDKNNNGDVQFFTSGQTLNEGTKLELSTKFLEEYLQELSCNETKQLHCLVLTNKLMAQLSGFSDIYSVFSNADKIYYKDIKTLLLSHEHEKLHPTILLIYRFIILHCKLHHEQTTFHDLFGTKKSNISFSEATTVIKNLRSGGCETLGDFLAIVSKTISTYEENPGIQECLKHSLSLSNSEIKETRVNGLEIYLRNILRDLLVRDTSEDLEDSDQENEKVKNLLSIPLSQWKLWTDFIDRRNQNKDIIYHTYHGTKGEEYDNVAVLMEHSFGRESRDKFKNYFKYIQVNESDKNEFLKNVKQSDLDNSQNLMYVVCSRAMKNLRILYLDDIAEISKGIESIFGEIKSFPP